MSVTLLEEWARALAGVEASAAREGDESKIPASADVRAAGGKTVERAAAGEAGMTTAAAALGSVVVLLCGLLP